MMSKISKNSGFETKAIHAGQVPDPSNGAIMTPIYATSTYVQESPGVHQGYEYSRSHNPTRKALEECITSLENGSKGYAFASGMAAIGTVLEILNSGDHVIAMDDLYGGTYRLFENVRKRSAGLDFSFVDLSDLNKLEDAVQPNTKMIWVESPTNPLLKLVDLAEIAKFAKANNIISVCDNTFCSPFIQKPLDFGIDIVVHSATKYLNGHSDVVGGVTVCAKHREDLGILFSMIANSSDNPLIIDVRTLDEWNNGHIEGSNHIEWQVISENIFDLTSDFNKKIYVYCRSGNRSGKAKNMLNALGFDNVINAGGKEEAESLIKSLDDSK